MVTARALAPLDRLLEMAAPLFSAGTTGLLLKGKDVEAEIRAAKTRRGFDVKLVPSLTQKDASIAVISRIETDLGPSREG